MTIDWAERAQRLDRVVAHAPVSGKSRLVKAIGLPRSLFDQLSGAVSTYIWHSLVQAFPQDAFLLGTDLLAKYGPRILALPNRTPNGVLLPRAETFLSFNLIQQGLVRLFDTLGMMNAFSSVQRACNVRVLAGTSDAIAESRPLSSSKLHTDVWAGEPLSTILFNIILLGEPDAVDLEFFEPRSFPENLLRPLADYDQGREIAALSSKCALRAEIGTLFVSDALSLHQTVKRRPGLRVSIDFRAIARELVAGESSGGSTSRADYVPVEAWQQDGTTTILTSAAPMDAFQRQQRGEKIASATFSLAPLDPGFG
jgi:hypothetical protein